MKTIKPSNSKLLLLVDDEDYLRCKALTWCLNKHLYATSRFGQERVMLHRFVLWMFDDDKRHVDHKDTNPLNCQKYNLRPCTVPQNHAHSVKRKGTSSLFKGVCWRASRNKWIAAIKLKGFQTYLGSFNDEDDAAKAYDLAALQEYGEFAVLNFPNSNLSEHL